MTSRIVRARSALGPDLSYIDAAATQIGPCLAPGAIVVNKSTVPVGTAEHVLRLLGRDDVHVASNPEFLKEGTAVSDFLRAERVVIGVSDRMVASRIAALYVEVEAPVLVTHPTSAEMIEYAANAFLATKLSFIDTVAELCEAYGADIEDVTRGMGSDGRIGHHFLRPGPGFGGSCFPKDTAALIKISEAVDLTFPILDSTLEVNARQVRRVVEKIRRMTLGGLGGARIGVLGPPRRTGRRRPGAGSRHLRARPRRRGARSADRLAQKYRDLEARKLGEIMHQRAIVDTRNVLDRKPFLTHVFRFVGTGR